MTECRVTAPEDITMDYDYIAFSFNGLHSYKDFGIYRTSDGDRYNEDLSPQMNDLTADNPSADGMYFFNAYHKQKNFNISFAFDDMDESTLRRMKKWLNGKEMGDLWFAEHPYKVYTVKVTGQPTIKYIPFDDYDRNGNRIRIYKGEGSVAFTAYWPYAHTPDYVGSGTASGKNFDSYSGFRNGSEWKIASGLTSLTGSCAGENPGDLPAPFVMKAPETITASGSSELTFKVGELEIKVPAATATKQGDDPYVYTHHQKIEWDSKTGMVSAEVSGKRVAISYTGNSLGGIPVGGILPADISINGGTLNYHYWYY